MIAALGTTGTTAFDPVAQIVEIAAQSGAGLAFPSQSLYVETLPRGADLFAASHVHRTVQALLGLPVPRWHHHPLLLGEDGEKLAKRRGSPALAERREGGEDGHMLAKQLRMQLLSLGT